MATMPSIDQLKAMYKDLMDDEEVRKISEWVEENTDEPTDETKYLEKALSSIESLNKKIIAAAEGLDL